MNTAPVSKSLNLDAPTNAFDEAVATAVRNSLAGHFDPRLGYNEWQGYSEKNLSGDRTNMEERSRRRRLKTQHHEAQQTSEQRRPVVRAEDLEFEEKKMRKKISYDAWLDQKKEKKQHADEARAAHHISQKAEAKKRAQERLEMDKQWQKEDRTKLTKARQLAVLDRLKRRIEVDRHDTADILRIKKEASERSESDPHLTVLFTPAFRGALSFDGHAFYDKEMDKKRFSIEHDLGTITAAVEFLKEELKKKVGVRVNRGVHVVKSHGLIVAKKHGVIVECCK
jgi:hypothetical protein